MPGFAAAEFAQHVLAASDDYLIAESVKRFGQAASDAGTAAGDQDRVFVHVH